jgi:hypothetical protein
VRGSLRTCFLATVLLVFLHPHVLRLGDVPKTSLNRREFMTQVGPPRLPFGIAGGERLRGSVSFRSVVACVGVGASVCALWDRWMMLKSQTGSNCDSLGRHIKYRHESTYGFCADETEDQPCLIYILYGYLRIDCIWKVTVLPVHRF